MMGFYHADAGRLRVDGREVRIGSPRHAHRHCLGMVYQYFTLVPGIPVAENLAIRNFDRPPNAVAGCFISRTAMRRQAATLMERFRIKAQGPDARIETLSGENVQRTVLARELATDLSVLVVHNPCFGLDLNAAAEIRNRIMAARNAGAAILLVSEDLDEILELADRIVVMFEGRLFYETPRATADVHAIGRHMASHP